MIRAHRVRFLLGLAAAVATVGGCTTERAVAQSAEPPIGAIPAVGSGADIVLPLDAYLMNEKQQETFSTAVLVLGRDCMKSFGLSWPVNGQKASDWTPPNARRYAIVEPQKAKTDGYHLSAATTEPAAQKAPSPEAMNVWAGQGERTFAGKPVPAGGCAGEAVRQLTRGAPTADPGLPEKLQLQTYARTKADSRVVRAFAAWSACMQAKGFSYPDPYAASADQRWRTPKAGPAEIAVATADVACKSQTRLPGLMLAVETAYQNRAAAQNAAALTAVKAYLGTELANAGRVAR
jgi:hypothetical protein